VFKPGWGDACALNADCPAGRLCVQGLCVPEQDVALCLDGQCLAQGQRCNRVNLVCEEDVGCLADEECARIELCNLPTHTCVNRCTSETVEADCGPGRRCVEGRCSECAGAGDCPGGLTCDLGKLACVLDGSSRCITNRDCPVGLTCNRATGFCTATPPPCLSNDDCLPDERCDVASGKCQLRTCQPDRFERNDTVSAAKELPVARQDGLTLCEGEEDWFSVTLARGDRLDVFIEVDPLLETQLTASLQDPTGRTLAAGALALGYVAALDGAHKLALKSQGASFEYALRPLLSTGTPCDFDRLEPNEDPGSASVIALGSHAALTLCPKERDFYEIAVPEGRGVKVEVEHRPTEVNLDLRAYDLSGTVIGESATSASIETLELSAAQAPGKVRVEVFARDGRTQGSYLLKAALWP